MLNLRQVNNQPGNPTLNSHILYQLDDQLANDDKEMGRPPLTTMNLDNLNLNLVAFDNVISPSDSDSSSGSSSLRNKFCSQDADLHDLNFKMIHMPPSPSSSTEHSESDTSSTKRENEIHEVRHIPHISVHNC